MYTFRLRYICFEGRDKGYVNLKKQKTKNNVAKDEWWKMEFNKHSLEGYDIQSLYNREDLVPPAFKSLTI